MKVPMRAVYVRFWDHVHSTPSEAVPLLCEVFGVLAKEDERAIYVHSWVCQRSLGDDNNEVFCIIKSTIEEFSELRRAARRPNNRRKRRESGSRSRPGQAKCRKDRK